MATVICPRVFSRARAVLAGLCCLFIEPAFALDIELALDEIRHPAFAASGMTLKFAAPSAERATLHIDRLQIADVEYRGLELNCRHFRFDGRELACPEGELQREVTRGRERSPLPFSLAWHSDGHFTFALRDIDVVALSPLVKRLRRWSPQGRADLSLRGDRNRVELALATRNLSFSSRDGSAAGRDMAFALQATATREAGAWRWHAGIDWTDGHFAMPPWQRDARVRIDAEGRLTDALLQVEQARLDVADIGAVTASLRWDRERGVATEWGLVSERIDLAAAMREWLQPWLSSLGLPAWQATGSVLFAAEWREAAPIPGLQRFFAGLDDATLADDTDYMRLEGMNAQIAWEAGQPQPAEISVAAARFGDLPLGEFRIPLLLDGNSARIEHLIAPLLDGRFSVERLVVDRVQNAWQAEFSGGIDGVSMPKLSRALRLPVMAGTLSAHIPRIAYENDVLSMDGALGVEVFDGGLIVHQLRMLAPFSARRHLLVDVTARGLDLGMLTRTFAFGSIEGRFDADLHDLEMAGWQPLRFDARIDSTSGDERRVLSIGALKDITALGTPEEGSAILRLPEREGFGLAYDRIGLGAVLRDGVCTLSGIPGHDADDRILIMQGSGMPSVDIIGYNRRIDWPALVARFREVLAGRQGLLVE